MNHRLIAAVILSPLVAPLIFSFLIVGVGMFQSSRNFVESVFPIAYVGIPLAYAFLLLVGMPVYLVLKKMHSLSFYAVVLLGGVVPPGLICIAMLAGGASLEEVFYKSFATYFSVGACGFFVSLVFWLIAYGRQWRVS